MADVDPDAVPAIGEKKDVRKGPPSNEGFEETPLQSSL
jgi:hypothetical protein